MSDISIRFTWLDWFWIAPVLGWPGLLLGAATGALLWPARRILAAAIGGVAGCVLYAAGRLFLF